MNQRETRPRQADGDLAFGDECLDARVVDHEVEAIIGIGRVEWKVCGAAVDGGEHADHHVETARERDADPIAATDARDAELVRQRTGRRLELCVGERA